MKKQVKLKIIIYSICSFYLMLLVSFYLPVSKDGIYSRLGFPYEIYDRNGILLRKGLSSNGFYFSKISYSEVPQYVINALIIAEDKRYYKHSGVDFFSLFSASLRNIISGKTYGGSTITMQLSRNIFNLRRNIFTKIFEIWMSIRLENSYSKQELLELYFNTIPFGKQIVGINSACRLYFNKSVADLSIAQSAFLIALLKYSNQLGTGSGYKKILNRQKHILKQLLNKKFIGKEEYNRSNAETIKLQDIDKTCFAPHFADYVLQYVKNNYSSVLGKIARIYTTLDYNIQVSVFNKACNEMRFLRNKRVTNSSVLVIKNDSMELLAMIGSLDYFTNKREGQVNGANAIRSPGSTLKPFVYATGIDNRIITASTVFPDIRTFIRSREGDYSPINDTRKFRGPITLRNALGCSYNVPVARAMTQITVTELLGKLRKLGFSHMTKTPEHYGASLGLGGADASLIELCQAYSALANQGVMRNIKIIKKIEDNNGKEIIINDMNIEERIFSSDAVYIISNILADNKAREDNFTLFSALNLPFFCAAKTGTSKGFRNNWTIGYSKNYTVGVWVGNFDNTPAEGLSGINGAGRIFRNIMLSIENNYDYKPSIPDNIIKRVICPKSGLLAKKECQSGISEFFIKGTEPGRFCDVHYFIPFYCGTNKIAASIRYNDSQMNNPLIEWRSVLLLPDIYNEWLENSGYRLSSSELIHYINNLRRNEENTFTEKSVQILFPDNRDVFAIDPLVNRNFQKIAFRAVIPPKTKSAIWYLNNNMLKASTHPFSIEWKITRGEYKLILEIFMENGQRIKSKAVHFIVR